MIQEVKEAIDVGLWLRSEWEKPRAVITLALLVLIFGLLGAYWFDFSKIQKSITFQELLVILGILGVLGIAWFISTRPPKTSRGKVGIIVGIDCESKKERQRFKNDVIKNLRAEIDKGRKKYFQILELSDYQSSKIEDIKNAAKYLKQTKGHLILYGQCRIRKHQGKASYVLTLHEFVIHSPAPKEVSEQLGREMRIALPPTWYFAEDLEITGFEFTKELLSIASRYTVGMASLVSGDPLTSFDIHHTLWKEIKIKLENDPDPFPVYKNLRIRLARFLVRSGLGAARVVYRTKESAYVNKMENFINVVQEIDPNNYPGHLLKGIVYFLKSHDIIAAKQEIRKAKNEKDSSWQYSSAFLEAYEGNLEKAHKIYQSAFRGNYSEDTPLDVEVFIEDVIKAEPKKFQLWYCLGMINYFCKKDLPSAKSDFSQFIELATKDNSFPTSIELAKKYIQEINEKLSSPI